MGLGTGIRHKRVRIDLAFETRPYPNRPDVTVVVGQQNRVLFFDPNPLVFRAISGPGATCPAGPDNWGLPAGMTTGVTCDNGMDNIRWDGFLPETAKVGASGSLYTYQLKNPGPTTTVTWRLTQATPTETAPNAAWFCLDFQNNETPPVAESDCYKVDGAGILGAKYSFSANGRTDSYQ